MKNRRLRLYGDSILLQKCLPVSSIDDSVEDIVLDMLEALKKYGGVGISAPQLGEALRIFIIKAPDKKEHIIINPVIKAQASEKQISTEGCLSIPGVIHNIQRSAWIETEYLDIDGESRVTRFEDLEACIFLHEFDHLEGTLIIHHMSPVQRGLIEKKLRSISKYNKLVFKAEKFTTS